MLGLWVILVNCTKEREQLNYPSHYKINLQNNYFEVLDSVWFDTKYVGVLRTDTNLLFSDVTRGEHSLRYISKSQIEFNSVFELKSVEDSIVVRITTAGKLELKQIP